MKILFPLEFFYPVTVGGPSSTLYWHTNYLSSRGIDIAVVATDNKLDMKKYGISSNQWIQYDSNRKVIFCRTKIRAFPWRAVLQTVREMFSSDVVHYSSAYYYLTIYTLFVAVILRKKVILSPRGEFFPCAVDSLKKRILINVFKLIQRRIVFHATSVEEEVAIRSFFPEGKIVSQPNFLDCEMRDCPENRNRNIIFLGLIYSVKKIENIIAALAKSEKFRRSDSMLQIIGEPLVARDYVYKEQLEAQIKQEGLEDKVVWLGRMEGEAKMKLLNESRFLVLPSEAENFGNVVVEALSQSTPVIASLGTPWRSLNEHNAGIWCDCSPESLRLQIEKLLDLPEQEYKIMCANAKRLVEEYFNIHTAKNNIWCRIYEEF